MLFNLSVLFFTLLGCSQTATTSMMDTTLLYQHWINSFEENDAKQGLRVFRPDTFAFPLARGREGFEIKEKGIFISHPIAPGDGNMSIEEHWTLKNDELIISSNDHNSRYKIISLSKEKLILKSVMEK
jgi:hypothetical protein